MLSLSISPSIFLSPSALRKTQLPTPGTNKAAASSSFPPPGLASTLSPSLLFTPLRLLPSHARPDSFSPPFALSSNPPAYPKASLPSERAKPLSCSLSLSLLLRHCCYRFGLGNVFFFGYFVATAPVTTTAAARPDNEDSRKAVCVQPRPFVRPSPHFSVSFASSFYVSVLPPLLRYIRCA